MLVEAIEPFKRLSGEIVNPGDVLDVPPEKIDGLIARGRVRPLPMSIEPEAASQNIHLSPDPAPGHPTLPEASETCLKTQNPGISIVRCGNCRHFIPDSINPPAGIGDCEAGAWQPRQNMPLQYPMAPRRCETYEERAAIKEFCGNMDRVTAEREAEEEACELFERRQK